MTKLFALLLVASTSSISAASVAQGSAAVTPEQVATLPPTELGRLLLGPTRLPIVEAYIYGEALEPPAPAGKPTVTRIALFEQASTSGEEGFCQKVRYMVRLKPVMRKSNGDLPPAPAALVTPSTLYRWKTTDGHGPTCEGKSFDFFSVSDANAQAVFGAIRQLAEVQSEARQGRPLQLTGSVDDQLGREGHFAAGDIGPITGWQTALKQFPISKIHFYDMRRTSSGFTWGLRTEEWTVDVAFSYGQGTPTSLSFRRFIAPPA